MLLPSDTTSGVQQGQRQSDVPVIGLKKCFQIVTREYPVLTGCKSPTLHFSIAVEENGQFVCLYLQTGHVDPLKLCTLSELR